MAMADPSPPADYVDDELSDEEDQDQDLSEDDDLLGPEEDPVKAAFDEIMTQVKMRKLDLKGASGKDLIARYGRFLGEKTAGGREDTLLHLAALEITNKPLVRLLLKRHPELMTAKNDTGKTPLDIAISRKKVHVLQTMCLRFKDGQVFDKLLAARHENQRNGIHLAILARLDPTVLVSLINRASEETLCARDDRGCTPLHLAVEYDRCTNSHFSVIRALIKQGDKAMDQFMNAPHEYSVYEYHEYTAAQRNAQKQPKPREEKPATSKRPEPEERGRPEAPKPSARSKVDRDPIPDKPGREQPNSRADQLRAKAAPQDLRLDLRLAMATRSVADDSRATVYEPEMAGIPKGPTVRIDSPGTSTPSKLAVRARTNTALWKSVGRKEEDKVTEESARRIKDELRLHYLRSTFQGREHEDAVRFLYGSNTRDVQICFDLLEAAAKLKSAKITQDEFKRSYDHIVFSDVLRYVALRTVDLEPLTPLPSSRPSKWARLVTDHTPQNPGRGRNDMVFFFQWLRDKGVKRILKVTVDDMTTPSHADEAIETALDGLQVEMLDWRKLDLCPAAVEKASKEVREIWLQWSGNNTVLRGWSEREGLPKLLMLHEVHLHAKEGLDAPARTAENIKAFQDRLQRERDEYHKLLSSRAEASPSKDKDDDQDDNVSQQEAEDAEKAKEDVKQAKAELEKISPHINVGVIEGGGTERHVPSGASAPNGANGKERLLPHRWLDCMDDFADQILNIQVPETNREELKQPVKVALVDDGVDIHYRTLRGRIQSGMTFDQGSPEEGRPSPYYVTSTGHGTVMADMICRVCPQVKLHVFKLQTHMSKDRVPQISARSAAHAIDAAVARKVDIISMSWTIRDTDDNRDDLELLGAAMSKAFAANILMFCAASDKGAHADTDYPAAWNVKRVFRIGAATAEGRAWTWTGDLANLDFILPGHNILDRTAGARSGSLLENFTPQTGSSVATAFAAGLAGLVLHCVRLGAIVSETSPYAAADTGGAGVAGVGAIKVKDLAEMRKHDNMKAAFKAIGTSDVGQHKFVEVWHRFEPACKELKSADALGRLDVVATLARDLIAGISGTKGQVG